MPAPIPARLLVKGDRVQLGAAVVDITAAYPLPGRVEVSFIGVDCKVGTDVLDPEQEIILVRSATEAVTA